MSDLKMQQKLSSQKRVKKTMTKNDTL